MMKFFELYIDSAIMWIAFYSIGKILFGNNNNIKITKLIITIFMTSFIIALINYINSEMYYGIIKISISYMILCIYNKVIFDLSGTKLFVSSLLIYLLSIISEIVIAINLSFLLEIFNHGSMEFIKNTILVNSMIFSLAYVITLIFQEKLSYLINSSSLNRIVDTFSIIAVLIVITILAFKIPLSKWLFNSEFIITMILLLCFAMIAIYLLKQKSDIHKTNQMYQQVVKYSDVTNNVLEEYSITNHEHKNQLTIIRSMAEDNPELIEYVDTLLEKIDNIKYKWVRQLNYIQDSGLKGLINYKILEMEKLKLKVAINVSKQITKVKINKLSIKHKDNLYSIIGVYLDNAIQAAKESKEKEVSLDIYKENKDLVIIVANTYKGKIKVDKLDEYGYTTKGSKHGTGLHLVKKILNSENIFSQKRVIDNEYYVEELRIILEKLSKK